jgi:molybdopterin molybdotransferase
VMIELDRALDIVRSVPASGRAETISIEEALGRVLAREVRSPLDSPPFDKSAMDGFAVGKDDDSADFHIMDTVAAGAPPSRSIRRGECARIMTWAMLPEGSGRVIRHEYVREEKGRIRLVTPEPGDNVIRRGASLRAGEPVVKPGVLGPHDLGALAASGIQRIDAAVPPRTAILCTGPEVRPAGTTLAPGQIYDSNGPQLRAQLAEMHCPSTSEVSGVDDEPGLLTAAITRALSGCDVLLLTGGVSAGTFDYVPGCLQALGAEILFHGVAIKPGKPALFARLGGQYIFGLPGNPVSTFVIFEIFVKPFLYRRMGIDWMPPSYMGTLAHTIRRTQDERTEFLPVRVFQGRVEAVAYHGSAHLNALSGADGLVRIDVGARELTEGTQVDVRPL